MDKQQVENAVRGLTYVEKRILALAAQRHIPGFKIEWNEDMDLGHLMDPVPIALLTDGGRINGKFSLKDLAALPTTPEPATVGDEIDRLVGELASTAHTGPPLHEPPGAP
jgi:hypothetical protein